jgi:hypothetical protein
LLSSASIYLINDIVDLPYDKMRRSPPRFPMMPPLLAVRVM